MGSRGWQTFSDRHVMYIPHINFKIKFHRQTRMGQRSLPVKMYFRLGTDSWVECRVEAGSLTDVCLLSRNRQPQFWMSLLNGISFIINASAEARKFFGDLSSTLLKEVAVKDGQIVLLLGV
jgi:hypothetical protein